MRDDTAIEVLGVSPTVLTVSQLNAQAKNLLERSFNNVAVAGEISNLKRDGSGHRYFCLKDSGAIVAAAMFRREAQTLRFDLKDGLQVVAVGRLTLYAPYGRYQMVVERLEVRGAGALQAAFAELKNRLAQEGLFQAARKRPLPLLPARVAVVTSPTGAVIRDIINVASRRFANTQILVVPTRVQGLDCGPQIARAIERIGRLHKSLGIDVLIVARGGGSLEELWGFNDEQVARAIFASPIPVVSAVGHETDFTIADFVADVRAPTPSAAAELVFPQKSELTFTLQRLTARAGVALRRDLQRMRYRVRTARAEMGDGRSRLLESAQRLAICQHQLDGRMRRLVQLRRQRFDGFVSRLARLHPRLRLQALQASLGAAHARLVWHGPALIAARRAQQELTWVRLQRANPVSRLPILRASLHTVERRLAFLLASTLQARREKLTTLIMRLDALSPLAVLGRGYSLVFNTAGQLVRHPADAAVGERLTVRLAAGELAVRVEAS